MTGRIGALLFDPVDPARASQLDGGGFAAVGGDVFRFESVDQVIEDHDGICWMTALTRSALGVSEVGARLIDNEFFATNLASILDELGVSIAHPAEAASAIAPILVRVEAICAAWGVTINARVRLPEALAAAFDASKEGDLAEQDPFFKAASASFISKGPRRVNDVVVRLPLHRVVQARRVLGSLVPAGAWKEANVKVITNAATWLKTIDAPVIAQVSSSKPSATVSAIVPRKQGNGKIWLAHPELMALGEFAEIQLDRALTAEAYRPVALKRPLSEVLPAGAIGASISFGLCAEALMTGICTHARAPQAAAWLTSVARLHAFREAARLSIERFTVVGYATCHVLVSVPKKKVSDLLAFLDQEQTLLMAPASLTRKNGAVIA